MNTSNADKTILLVDDEYMIRQVVEICLENLSSWKTIIAASGKEALDAIAISKPDAILLDMMMPNMDGFTVIEQLQANIEFMNIPIVLLTSCTSLLSHQDLMALGCKGIIAKPFEPTYLVPQIANILGW